MVSLEEPATGNEVPKIPDYTPRVDHKEPLKLAGVLDQYEQFDATPVIGTEFPTAKLVEWMNAPNSDELLRDLAITGKFNLVPLPLFNVRNSVSRRGVVFFRAQDDLTSEMQKDLAQRLGVLSGKPATSGLHIHPINNSRRGHPGTDDHITAIGDVQTKSYGGQGGFFFDNQEGKMQTGRLEWHSDITFEPVPGDYAILRMEKFPKAGGDTLWASGYEVYDRISRPYQKFLETLTATCGQDHFAEVAKRGGFELFEGPRGAPENSGSDLSAIHPVVRTNPVTGWKNIFPVGVHVKKINGLTPLESQRILDGFLSLIMENHDLQVRYKWVNPNDVAIWDNRSVFHAATRDHEGGRSGFRATGLGERPYLDPESTSRRESFALTGERR